MREQTREDEACFGLPLCLCYPLHYDPPNIELQRVLHKVENDGGLSVDVSPVGYGDEGITEEDILEVL
ncbi:hypothetical protein Dsin_032162 [Dipteronia sinensis]|uniref:Uncharacterized protein n=1 Tax=Dipteronia sinensis TaxID=43782 RepID=A0AAE0DST4_9ROSI|nr:hypothetical protein Dsin_032162 [Dipteronia sinensis]